MKRRIIVDSKENGITAATRRDHKTVLPRITDVVDDAMVLMREGRTRFAKFRTATQLEALVLDFVEAFWQLPLRPEERRFFCAKIRGYFYVFLRTPQGSRGAPLTWLAFIALVARLSMAAGEHFGSLVDALVALSVYVDDPIVLTFGRVPAAERTMLRVAICLALFGLPLAFEKASRGTSVKWIGFNLHFSIEQVVAELPEDKLIDIRTMLLSFLDDHGGRNNVLRVKVFRTFLGKCASVASLIYV